MDNQPHRGGQFGAVVGLFAAMMALIGVGFAFTFWRSLIPIGEDGPGLFSPPPPPLPPNPYAAFPLKPDTGSDFTAEVVSVTPSGMITARVTNRGPYVRRCPGVKVVFLDRFGDTVTVRMLYPPMKQDWAPGLEPGKTCEIEVGPIPPQAVAGKLAATDCFGP